MKISTILYTLRQGIVNLFRNKWYSLASIATVSACLFLFSIFYSLVMNFQHLLDTVQEGVCVTVFFEEGLSEENMLKIGEMIEVRDEVSKMNFISADEAWEDFQKIYFGEYADEFAEGYPDNPLAEHANYEVFIEDVSKQADLVTYIESIQGVRYVRQDVQVADALTGVNMLISYVSVAIIGILLAVSIFLIANTVTTGISMRKEEINIMKYVGATDFFVRAPFVVEGIIIGLIGACIPLLLVHQMYDKLTSYVLDKLAGMIKWLEFLKVEDIFVNLTPVCLIVGVGIGFLGSFVTVRKHLHV